MKEHIKLLKIQQHFHSGRQKIPNWYIGYTMEFEFDPNKSKINKNKHGINFIEAQERWNDADLLEIPAKTSDEAIVMFKPNTIGLQSGRKSLLWPRLS